jgi:hypothetical protein
LLWCRAFCGSPRFDQEIVLPFRWSIALCAALAAACATVSAPRAGSACGPSGYAYAGVQATKSHGISAVVTSLGTPAVESGHVAGWVGVGAPGEGPGGSDEWIQVGLNSLPGTGNTLYYEVMRPGASASYSEVATSVGNGRPVRVAVLETAANPNAWRIWVDGRPVTPPIELTGSRGALTPMAMGESWDGGRPACNRYSYRFEGVSVAQAPGGSWQAARAEAVLQDPGYRVVGRAPDSFVASATRPLAPSPQ